MNVYYKFAIISLIYSICADLALERIHRQSSERVAAYFGNTTMIIVAHPDDETMFFGPTIMNLMLNSKSLHILCISSGDADGLGRLRKIELARVTEALGPQASHELIDERELRDSMIDRWNSTKVSDLIELSVKNYHKPIETVVTFDSYGVSGHPNHIAIHQSLKNLKQRSLEKYGQSSILRNKRQVDYFSLVSVPFWRKYTLFLDSVVTVLYECLFSAGNKPDHFVLGLDFRNYTKLRRILHLHKSQMVWFRQLYMTFSRYMFINDLEKY